MKYELFGLEVDKLIVPHLNPNDEVVSISHWNVENGQYVNIEMEIFTIETSKASYEFCSESSGYVYFFNQDKVQYNVGEVIGIISPFKELSVTLLEQFKHEILNVVSIAEKHIDRPDVVISKKARVLIQLNSIDIDDLDKSSGFIRESDVLNYIKKSNDVLSGDSSSDKGVIQQQNEKHQDVKRNYIDDFNHIKTGDNCFIGQGVSMTNVVLGHRVWINRNATLYGSGVSIGDDCYIGPSTWIEGHGGIIIGNSVHIAGPSTCLYTHSGIKIALGGEKLGNPGFKTISKGYYHEEIRIGNNVWIGPNCTLFPGVIIEDYVVIFPNTLVKKGLYKSFSLILPNGSIEENSEFVRNLVKIKH
jgi:acetyltransferase-like isoleucine patch superfamily enzyme